MRRRSRGLVGGRIVSGAAACALAAFMIVVPAGATSAVAAASAGQPTWKIQKSPDATVPGGQLNSISCSSAKACGAVGTNVSTAGVSVTLAERWNGSSWQRQGTPNPPDTVPITSPDLLGMSCPNSHFCMAVGGYQVSTVGISLAEEWNGLAWVRVRFPVPLGSYSAYLFNAACTSSRFCEATGVYRDSVGDNLAFAARWNGTAWSLQHMPSPAGSTIDRVGGVSCVSPMFCEAVGSSDAGTFAVRWNGTNWHLQPIPGTAGVAAVSCASASFCESVGSGGGDTWNGSSWSAQPIPSPAGAASASLSGVSCPTAIFCEAVGGYSDNSGNTFSFAATWNGTSWTLQTTPDPSGTTSTSLSSVSCAAATACEAGGDFQSSAGPVALAESWNGTSWQIQRAVTPPAAVANSLSAVSCVLASFCEAVGSHPDRSGATIALAEAWNGTRWKIQKTADPAKASSGVRMSLAGVSCVSVRFCVAVGSSSSTAGGGAEVWNGTAWRLASVPATALTAVSCTSAKFCMAAGADGHVDIWKGTSWLARPTAAGFTGLSSVSCASPRFCEAIGTGPSGDEAEGWNGAAWSAQATPIPTGANSIVLSAVSCSGTKSCEAVGNYFNSSVEQVTLAEAWNGTAWAVQPTTNPKVPFATSLLLGVSCRSATSCTAVGQYSSLGPSLALAEVWNGAAWRLRSLPSHSYAGQNILSGVSCGATQRCTAVGVTDDFGQILATLVETGD